MTINKLYPVEERNAKDFEKFDNETVCGPPWRNTISGSQSSLFLELEDTNIASKGLLAPEMEHTQAIKINAL